MRRGSNKAEEDKNFTFTMPEGADATSFNNTPLVSIEGNTHDI